MRGLAGVSHPHPPRPGPRPLLRASPQDSGKGAWQRAAPRGAVVADGWEQERAGGRLGLSAWAVTGPEGGGTDAHSWPPETTKPPPQAQRDRGQQTVFITTQGKRVTDNKQSQRVTTRVPVSHRGVPPHPSSTHWRLAGSGRRPLPRESSRGPRPPPPARSGTSSRPRPWAGGRLWDPQAQPGERTWPAGSGRPGRHPPPPRGVRCTPKPPLLPAHCAQKPRGRRKWRLTHVPDATRFAAAFCQ